MHDLLRYPFDQQQNGRNLISAPLWIVFLWLQVCHHHRSGGNHITGQVIGNLRHARRSLVTFELHIQKSGISFVPVVVRGDSLFRLGRHHGQCLKDSFQIKHSDKENHVLSSWCLMDPMSLSRWQCQLMDIGFTKDQLLLHLLILQILQKLIPTTVLPFNYQSTAS